MNQPIADRAESAASRLGSSTAISRPIAAGGPSRALARTVGLALCLGFALTTAASAQVMGPTLPILDRPAVSPYLNMVDNGFNFSGVSNYQTLVRPLIEQQESAGLQGQAIRQLQRQVTNASSPYAARGARGVRSTGHSTRFMNYSHYYAPTSIRQTAHY
jgi:hypothetical protein